MGTTRMGIIVRDTKKPFPFDKEKIEKVNKTEEGYSILVHGGVNHFDDRACVALFRKLGYRESATLQDWLFDGREYHDAIVMQTVF